LTQFGYNEVANDLNVAQGGVLYRLLMRAFPGWYEYNSVYALFPLTIPSENKKILQNLGKQSQFSFNSPSPPTKPIILSTVQSAQQVLTNPLSCNFIWNKTIYNLTGESLIERQFKTSNVTSNAKIL
jgi:linoleate 10R-lipoxygenase